MYARSTIMRGDPSRMDEGIAMVRDEVVPLTEEMDGCVGISMLVDRSTGLGITTTAWEDRDAMRATAQRVTPLRERGAELMRGTPEVREWEIALLHRETAVPDGAYARVTWTRGDASHADRDVEIFRDHVLPQLSDLDGFCSVSLFIDPDTGDGATATVFRDRAALEASREMATRIRNEATAQMGRHVTDIAEFEVVYARLRVPETV